MEFDGQPLAVDTRKATAILAYLAVSGNVQSRDIIATLLWPEYDGERARAALRRTLSTLRTSLGGERLVTDRGAVSLDLSDAWFDLAEFRRVTADPTATPAALADAVDLHRGDLLAGFAVRDSAAFDDWQRAAADTARRELATALDRLIGELAASGRLDEAVARAEQRLALDPLHEPAHRRLIELYAASGRRADALAQYRECVRALDRELGVRPLSETTELYNAVNEGRTPQRPAAPAPAPATAQRLVGRDHSFRRLSGAHAAMAGDGGVVVIEGESGVGKTRLAEEFLAARAGTRARVISARAHPGERGLAYGVLAQLLAGAAELAGDEMPEHCRSEAARLLPELGQPPLTGLAEPGARQRFLDAASRLLTVAVAGRSAGIVFVDDLHASDPASIDALTYIGRRLKGRPMLLLAALRTDEPDPEHAYRGFAALGERVTLQRLTADDVAELAREAGLDNAAGDRLYAESEGLPLYLAELLAGDAGAAEGASEVFARAARRRLGDRVPGARRGGGDRPHVRRRYRAAGQRPVGRRGGGRARRAGDARAHRRARPRVRLRARAPAKPAGGAGWARAPAAPARPGGRGPHPLARRACAHRAPPGARGRHRGCRRGLRGGRRPGPPARRHGRGA